MNTKEYLDFHKMMCNKMVKITAAKNSDYAGSDSDPFANFRLTETFGVTSVEAGFFTRITDKLSRIASFIKKGTLQVKDESVEDTLLDLANYCILFAGYLKSKRNNGDPNGTTTTAPCEPITISAGDRALFGRPVLADFTRGKA